MVRFVFAIFVVLASPADACSGPDSQETVFFDEIPERFNGPNAFRASAIRQAWFSDYFILRVHETLKGVARPKFINVRNVSTASCGPAIWAGASGIVIGTLRIESGEYVLDAVSESYRERQRRLSLN